MGEEPTAPDQPRHVVMFSGGVGSYVAAARVVAAHGPSDVTLLFADVKGQNESPHAGEDEDTYRFLREAAGALGCRLVWLRQDEDVWDVFRRRRRIGSSYAANCSEELKQKPARRWLAENCPDPTGTTIHLGIDWSEDHRCAAVERAYAPRPVSFPLLAPPLLGKAEMRDFAREHGLEPPRMYAAGFPHANCGGFCVRAGKAQFGLLLREHPERFKYHEEQEQRTREFLAKDVSVLQTTRGGRKVPLTLRRFREQVEAQGELFDPDEWGGCGCFVAEEGGGGRG